MTDIIHTSVIYICSALLCRNQYEKVPFGLIMLGYFLVAMRFLSSSDIGGPYILLSRSRFGLRALCDGGRYLSGCGITGVFFCFICSAALRRRNSAERPLEGVDAYRKFVVGPSTRRVCGRRRSGPRGKRKRGIDWNVWRDVMVVRSNDCGAALMRESDG